MRASIVLIALASSAEAASQVGKAKNNSVQVTDLKKNNSVQRSIGKNSKKQRALQKKERAQLAKDLKSPGFVTLNKDGHVQMIEDFAGKKQPAMKHFLSKKQQKRGLQSAGKVIMDGAMSAVGSLTGSVTKAFTSNALNDEANQGNTFAASFSKSFFASDGQTEGSACMTQFECDGSSYMVDITPSDMDQAAYKTDDYDKNDIFTTYDSVFGDQMFSWGQIEMAYHKGARVLCAHSTAPFMALYMDQYCQDEELIDEAKTNFMNNSTGEAEMPMNDDGTMKENYMDLMQKWMLCFADETMVEKKKWVQRNEWDAVTGYTLPCPVTAALYMKEEVHFTMDNCETEGGNCNMIPKENPLSTIVSLSEEYFIDQALNKIQDALGTSRPAAAAAAMEGEDSSAQGGALVGVSFVTMVFGALMF